MLPGRLTTAAAAVVASLTLAACAGVDGTDEGVIRENVIEPGITAIDDARIAACGAEASSFRTALEAYDVLEGDPAPDEQALIDRGLLRSDSALWDIVDGELVAQDPACGDVPTTVPATEIVTDEDASDALTVDGVLATFTVADVTAVGGTDCARQLAVVIAAAARYTQREGTDPRSLSDLSSGGDLSEPVKSWEVVNDVLRPTSGSSCTDFAAAEVAEVCSVEIRTLDVAREAYEAQFGSAPTTQQELIDAGFIREPGPGDVASVELVDGVPRPVPGGRCDGVDPASPTIATSSEAAPCDLDRQTLEVAIEAYSAATGGPPASEQDLVASEMLRTEVPAFDVLPGGEIVAAPGRGCE